MRCKFDSAFYFLYLHNSMILKVYYYCFYRITKGYKAWGENNPEITGQHIIAICQSLFVGIFINLHCILTSSTLYYDIVILVVYIGFLVLNIFILTDKKYDYFEEHWKNESLSRRQKNVQLIWLSIITLIILFVFTVYNVPDELLSETFIGKYIWK